MPEPLEISVSLTYCRQCARRLQDQKAEFLAHSGRGKIPGVFYGKNRLYLFSGTVLAGSYNFTPVIGCLADLFLNRTFSEDSL